LGDKNVKHFWKAIIAVIVLSIALWLWGGNFPIGSETLHATSEMEISGSAVSVAIGDSLLFRTPQNDVGAIQFEKMTDGLGADYFSWFVPSTDSDKRFLPEEATKGHVFEKYWKTRIGLNRYHVIDLGGDYNIECGPIKLGWSASTWVYFPDGFEIAVMGKGKLSDVDINTSKISWQKLRHE